MPFTNLTAVKNSYLVAILSIILTRIDRAEEAHFFAELLTTLQRDDGKIYIEDESRVIETTAIAVLVWLNYSDYWQAIEKAITFLYSICKNCRFGSTQSTVFVLKAIIKYDQQRNQTSANGGLVIIRLDGKQVGSKKIKRDVKETIEAPSFADTLTAGDHKIELQLKDGRRIPYSLMIDYHSLSGTTHPYCNLRLRTSLSVGKLSEGSICQLTITAQNISTTMLPVTGSKLQLNVFFLTVIF